MAFVKLDTGILNSTLWVERECREVFITALLMAEPKEFEHPVEAIEVRSLSHTGWSAPPGWYGFIEAAGVGIVRRAMVDQETGLSALEKLGSIDPESRSKDYDGRRLVRVDGGYLVLNFMKYRDRDHTSAVRSQRYRDRQKAMSRRDDTPSPSDITQAEAEAEAYKINAAGFALFWDLWPQHPRKTAKRQCFDKWANLGCEAIQRQVLDGLLRATHSAQWAKDGGSFIPAPLTWLNQKRWDAPAEAHQDQAAESSAVLKQMKADQVASQTPEAMAARKLAIADLRQSKSAATSPR